MNLYSVKMFQLVGQVVDARNHDRILLRVATRSNASRTNLWNVVNRHLYSSLMNPSVTRSVDKFFKWVVNWPVKGLKFVRKVGVGNDKIITSRVLLKKSSEFTIRIG